MTLPPPDARALLNLVPVALREPPDDAPEAPLVLDALLAAVEAQRTLLAADIDELWEDFFVESCADWAVPYLGALLGLPPDAERLEVAYAVALRRRKGTPAALEDFAEVVTGLPARVTEGWQITRWAQRPGHPPPPRVDALDLAAKVRLRVGTPFENARRSVLPGGRWSPRTASVIVWPWQTRTFRLVQAAPLEPAPNANHRFALHPLRAEAPVYLAPRPLKLRSDADGDGAEGSSPVRYRTADETDAPVRATYALLQVVAGDADIAFGSTWTLAATHPVATPANSNVTPLIRLEVGGNAISWSDLRFGVVPAPTAPPGNGVIVDPVHGRVELGPNPAAALAAGPLRATWHRPLAGSIGALAGDSRLHHTARIVKEIGPGAAADSLQNAVDAAVTDWTALGLTAASSQAGRPDVEIRLLTSDRIEITKALRTPTAIPRWRIVAPLFCTPTIVGDLELDLADACVEIDGCYVTGDITLDASLNGVTLRHVTMDPAAGRRLVVAPSAWDLELCIDHSIVGAVLADLSASPITITDSIVDAHGVALNVCIESPSGTPTADAVAARTTATPKPGPDLRATGVTFAGAVRVESIEAANCIFVDEVDVVQSQLGCLRWCYGPNLGPDNTGNRPPAYECIDAPPPVFASVGFEAAGYYALTLDEDQPCLSAAGDRGELGAYHHARHGQRIRRLRDRIDEFVPLDVQPLVELASWEE